jgi:predicted dithiol-disulfide oxidoreductase (DUF899 family)
MAEHRTGTREEWEAAREDLLRREKELTRLNDEVARQRQELPWVQIDKEYSFETEGGTRTLAELFDGRSQLVIYNFMFGPQYEAGCPVCSSIADSFDGVLAHLAARDVTMICVSRAPLEKLLAYRERMGWSFNWASSHGSDFNFDFERSQSEDQVSAMLEDGASPTIQKISSDCGTDPAGFLEEGPGLTVFALADDGEVHLTYAATARGLEPLMVYYAILDRAPLGRHEDDPPELWFRRHDEYAAVS